MEMMKSSLLSTWKLFLLSCFCVGVFSILFIDKIQLNVSLSAAKNDMVELDPSTTTTTSIEPSDLTTRPVIAPPLIISPMFDPNYVTTSPPEVLPSNNVETKEECDIFDGRWVYKADNKVAYNGMSCPFLEEGVSCQKNGRSDSDYEKWRWEARDCDIPLFDGRDMLERLRNKRMIIVGDSINRNMWESLACLIYSSVPSSPTEVNVKSSAHMTFKAQDYNFTVEFYMSPFLIELDSKHKSGRKVLILDRISPLSKEWQGADIMVFNSANWWVHNDNIKAWDLFEYKGKLTENTPREIAYKRGMRTWAAWIKKNVNPNKTSVYFRSVSPTHNAEKYNQWCQNVTHPMIDDSYVMDFPRPLIEVIVSVIKRLRKLQVKYLNITKLSQYRIDAHPSIYTVNLGFNLPVRPDCSHWCLPGLPDTWNRLLYASILFDTISDN